MNARECACLLGALAAVAIAGKASPDVPGASGSPPDTSRAQARHSFAALPGTFAYGDSSGTELLALGAVDDPAAVIGAVCFGARVLPVRYDRTQESGPGDTGRQVARNFRNDAGRVFRIGLGTARPNETCYLSADSVVLAGAVSVRPLGLPPCSRNHTDRVTATRRREVLHCWRVAEVPSEAELLAVQFATVDSSALASFVLIRDTSLRFHDFPAVYRGPDQDVWRVDDQGVFSPEDFEIVFVVPLPHAFAMAITWAGAEGGANQFLVADSADLFREVVSDYRYWAPI